MTTKTTKNDKINMWTISRVWLRVSSSVDSTWITQHPNTWILQNHTVHVQAWMCNLCSDTSPCLLSPGQCILFFLRVLSMGGSLIFELDVDSRPCILMHLWKRRREKEHLRNTCPSNLDCISSLDCISLLKLCGIYFGKVQASTRQSQPKDHVEHLRLRPKIQKPTWKVCLI